MHTDSLIQLTEKLGFSLPIENQSALNVIKNNWYFDVAAAKKLVQSDAPQFGVLARLACTNIEDVPQKIAFLSLDYNINEKSLDVIETGSVVGVYAHPFITAQHLFTPRYAQITLNDQVNKTYPPQEVANVSIPRLLSLRQIKWFEKMGYSICEEEETLPIDTFLFLRQNNYINDILSSQKMVHFGNPFIGSLANLFELPDFDPHEDYEAEDDEGIHPRIIHHQKTLIFSALLDYLTSGVLSKEDTNNQSITHRSLLNLEYKANLNLLTRLEQFRAYACLQTASQNIHTAHEPQGIYRGVMQLRGLQPYFYLTLDQPGFLIAERLLGMGHTLHPKLMPAFKRSIDALRADGKLPAHQNRAATYTTGILNQISFTSAQIMADLVSHHTPKNSSNAT